LKNTLFLTAIIYVLCLFHTPNLQAQDIHFSQYYASPLSLNPANTGNYSGDWRLMNSYRRQWKSIKEPFVTNAIAYDRNFYVLNENFSAGLIFINDKSGGANLAVNKIMLSMAYHKAIKGHHLHLGYQIGYVQKNINLAGVTFPDQYDRNTGGFNTMLPNNETFNGTQLSYVDMNIGLIYGKRIGIFDLEAGLAFFHFNYPRETFFSPGNSLISRKLLHFSAKVDLTEKIFLQPKILMMGTTKATDYLAGTLSGYRIAENKATIKSVFAGILLRNGISRNNDAFIAIAGINFKAFDLGFSYDYNVSDLKTATNYLGGFELSFIYTGISTVLKKVSIPCDRY
jgi:type IX secretion system PorP/SprF family membrane protein